MSLGGSKSFGGFGSNALGDAVSISYISGQPVPDKLNDADLVVIFRSMLKTSTVTRERGLNDLLAILRDKERVEITVSDAEFQWQWVLLYPKLAIDVSLTVRQLAQQAQGIIYKSLGRRASRYLTDCIGPWMCGLYDTGRGVSKVVQEALELVFPTEEKRESLWLLFNEDLLHFIHQTLTVETQNTLYDERYVTKEEASQSYYRVMQSCVSALSVMILTKKTTKIAGGNDDLSDLLHDTNFWAFMNCGNSSLQKTVLQFARGVIVEHKEALLADKDDSHYSKSIIALVTSNLVKSCDSPPKNLPGQVLPSLIRTIGFVTNRIGEEIWELSSNKGSSKALKAFKSLLLQGSRESNSLFWKEVPEFLESFDSEFKAQAQEALFSAIRKETFATTIEDAVKALLQSYSDSNVDATLIEMVSLSDCSFSSSLYELLQSKAQGPYDSIVEKCLEKDRKDLSKQTSSARKTNRLSHLGKILTIVEKKGAKSPTLERLIQDTLANFDTGNMDLVLNIFDYDKKGVYKTDDSTLESFLQKLSSSKDINESALRVAVKISDSNRLQETMASLVRNLLDTPDGYVVDLLEYFDVFPAMRPIPELETYLLHEADSFHDDSELARNLLVYGILSHDVLISRNTAFALLSKVSNLLLAPDPDAAKYILISVANLDKSIVVEFCKDTKDGPELLIRLYDVGEDSLVKRFTSSSGKAETASTEQSEATTDVIADQLKAVDLNHVDGLLQMVGDLWQGSFNEVIDKVKPQLTAESAEFSIPLDISMKYDAALIVDCRPYHPVSNEILARAIFILHLTQQKDVVIDTGSLLELALISEMIRVKEFYCGDLLARYPPLSSFLSTVEKLMHDAGDDLVEMIISHREPAPSGYEFYKARVLERLLNGGTILDPTSLLTPVRSKKQADLSTLAVIGALKDPKSVTPLRNDIAASFIGGPVPEYSRLILLNALLSCDEGPDGTIPLMRLVMFLKTTSSWAQSPGACDSKFLPTRIEITVSLYHIFKTYGEAVPYRNWTEMFNIIEQNLAVTLAEKDDISDYSRSLFSSLTSWTLKLLEISVDNANLIDPSSGLGNIIGQVAGTILVNAKGVNCLGQQYLAVLAKIPEQVVSEITHENIERLYKALEEIGTDSIRKAAGYILNKSISSRQQDITIRYQVDKSFNVDISSHLLNIISEEDMSDKLRLLTTWDLIMAHFDESTYDLRRKYIEQVEKYAGNLLDALFTDILVESTKTPPKPDEIEKVVAFSFLSENDTAESHGLSVFQKMLSYMHSVVRSWYINIRKPAVSKLVEDVTRIYFSKMMINRELDSVSKVDDNEFRVVKRTNYVRVFWKIDEEESEFEIHFPELYPLQDISIINKKLVGIDEKTFRGWSASMRAVSVQQSGRLMEILIILKRSIRLYFEEAEQCPICYSLISSDLTLPVKTCHTCKKKFHTDCLYNWFKSSRDTLCPLCRGKFNFKMDHR